MLNVYILVENVQLHAADLVLRPRCELAYRQEFVLFVTRAQSDLQLAQALPICLMEVFENERVETWLGMFKPLSPVQISPHITLGNVSIQEYASTTKKELSSLSVELKDVFHEQPIVQYEQMRVLRKLTGGFANQSFVFAERKANSLYSFQPNNVQPNAQLLYIPANIIAAAQQQQDMPTALRYCATHTKFFLELNKRLNQDHNNLRLDNSTQFLIRPDIRRYKDKIEWSPVETLAAVLYEPGAKNINSLDLFSKCVSTNIQMRFGVEKLEQWTIEFLKRDIVARLFFASNAGIAQGLLRVDGKLQFLPIVWSSGAEAMQQRMRIDWPDHLFDGAHLDYAMLCAELGDVVDSSEVLFGLTEFAETLLDLIPELLSFDPQFGEQICQYYGVHNIAQKLTRWGVLL